MRAFKIPLTKAVFIGDKPGVILEIRPTGRGSTLYLDVYRVSYRSVKDILLSRRVENKLLELGIETLVDLLGFSSPYRWANQKLETRKALLSVSGLGKKSLIEIEKALALEKLTLDLTPDSDLLRRAKEGDAEAKNTLVDKYPILLAKERLGTIYFDFPLGLAEVSNTRKVAEHFGDKAAAIYARGAGNGPGLRVVVDGEEL